MLLKLMNHTEYTIAFIEPRYRRYPEANEFLHVINIRYGISALDDKTSRSKFFLSVTLIYEISTSSNKLLTTLA